MDNDGERFLLQQAALEIVTPGTPEVTMLGEWEGSATMMVPMGEEQLGLPELGES